MKQGVILCIVSVLSIITTTASAQDGCICPEVYDPVCGDDGEDYSNVCFAECIGADVLYEGECIWKWVDYPIESPHPYPNNYNENWWIEPPEEAAMLRLYFFYIFTQRGHDYLEFYNREGLLETLSGWHFFDWVELETGSVDMRLVTDERIRSWGFSMFGYSYLAYPEQNPCEQEGGICIPVVPGSECDVGYYLDPDVPCSGLGAQCCLPYDCVPEGEPTMPPYNCCDGLSPVSDCLPDEPCPISLRYCVLCGNGSCDPHENEYNCGMDCHDPSCDDGTEILCDMIPPVCETDEILAYQRQCYQCVDPNTCS